MTRGRLVQIYPRYHSGKQWAVTLFIFCRCEAVLKWQLLYFNKETASHDAPQGQDFSDEGG